MAETTRIIAITASVVPGQVAVAQVEERPVVGGRLDRRVARQHARRARRVRLAVTPAPGPGPRRRRQRAQPRPGHQDAEIRARLVHVHAGLLAERRRRRVGEPIDQPALAEVVVDHQHAVAASVLAHRRGTTPP